MSICDLTSRNHRDDFFGNNDDDKCWGCGEELPETEAGGLVIEDDRENGGPVRLFCSEHCASHYDPGIEEDLCLEDPEEEAWHRMNDAQEDDPRDRDPEDYPDPD